MFDKEQEKTRLAKIGYETFYKLERGSSSKAAVEASSAGIEGWSNSGKLPESGKTIFKIPCRHEIAKSEPEISINIETPSEELKGIVCIDDTIRKGKMCNSPIVDVEFALSTVLSFVITSSHSQYYKFCTETPSKARLLMASYPSQILHGQLPNQTTSDSMATPITHPPDPFPSTVGPRLHQGVRFPHPSTSSCPAGYTSVFGTSPSPSRFKFFFLY